MAFKKPANKWTDLAKVAIIQRNASTQLRVSVVYKDEEMDNPYLSIKEFSRYVTKDEREQGLTLEDAIYRPKVDRHGSATGCTAPLRCGEDLAKAISKATKEALKALEKAGVEYEM